MAFAVSWQIGAICIVQVPYPDIVHTMNRLYTSRISSIQACFCVVGDQGLGDPAIHQVN